MSVLRPLCLVLWAVPRPQRAWSRVFGPTRLPAATHCTAELGAKEQDDQGSKDRPVTTAKDPRTDCYTELESALMPDAERPANRDQLTEMIRVVIDYQQQRAKVCLPPLACRDRGKEIDRDVLR